MIVERELEIEAFKPREYWTLEGDIDSKGARFSGRLSEYRGEKVEQFSFVNAEQAHAARDAVSAAAGGKVRVQKIDRKQRKRNPAAPFTTSTLQQEAARKLGFNTQRTMRTAQSLYEGIETDEGTTGLITYMRTDSVALAAEAITEIRSYIGQRFGAANVPAEARVYKTKAKNAQEAHEGIRPTSVLRDPESLKHALDDDQLRLYTLIWKRTIACQMVPAVFNTVAVDLVPAATPEIARLRASGSTLVEPGFIAVYQESTDDAADDENERTLPPLEEGDVLDLADFRADQHFTDPPPRYTEASLVKALEEYGIGRPSTYASIISTLKNREYVEMEGKSFRPSDIGRIVSGFLTNHFTNLVDYDFTARLEDVLDEISRGERDWKPVLEDFWVPFTALVKEKDASVSREEAAQSRLLGTDPKTGKPVSVRMGRYGPFVQIGTKDDEDKPKFAGLRPGQKINEITFDQAMELFKLPRKLGENAEGQTVYASIGRFGPYVRYGDKYVSIRTEDPYTIELDRALELIREKQIADANKLILDFPDHGIQVLNGQYGPYITNKEKNAKIPKDRDPKTLTLAECIELLDKAPLRSKRGKKKVAKKAPQKKVVEKKAPAKKKKKKKKAVAKKGTSRKTSKRPTGATAPAPDNAAE
jgi:DNA topoisomerase-1